MSEREIDPEVRRIFEELERQGKPQAALGRLLGLDPKQVNRLKNGERRLQRHEYDAALQFLGLQPLAGGGGDRHGTVVGMPGLVPLYGWVGASSPSRLTIAEQSLRGYVQMHPNQANVRDAFALEVADVSMSPRYEPGEIIYVAPNRHPKPGQDCVIVTIEAEGLLKRYVGKDATKIVLFQLNPEGSLEIDLQDLSAIHTVVGRG